MARREGKRSEKATNGLGNNAIDTKEETVAPWSGQINRTNRQPSTSKTVESVIGNAKYQDSLFDGHYRVLQ